MTDEVAKVLWGGVRNENNPAINNDLFKFPVDAKTGVPATYTLGNTPYVEVIAAIANIFKIARVNNGNVFLLTFLYNSYNRVIPS